MNRTTHFLAMVVLTLLRLSADELTVKAIRYNPSVALLFSIKGARSQAIRVTSTVLTQFQAKATFSDGAAEDQLLFSTNN